jgi:hypothetical protein
MTAMTPQMMLNKFFLMTSIDFSAPLNRGGIEGCSRQSVRDGY